MSNFTFLKTDWPDLYETAREAEQNVNSAPRTSCFYARRSLEIAVKWLYFPNAIVTAKLKCLLANDFVLVYILTIYKEP